MNVRWATATRLRSRTPIMQASAHTPVIRTMPAPSLSGKSGSDCWAGATDRPASLVGDFRICGSRNCGSIVGSTTLDLCPFHLATWLLGSLQRDRRRLAAAEPVAREVRTLTERAVTRPRWPGSTRRWSPGDHNLLVAGARLTCRGRVSGLGGQVGPGAGRQGGHKLLVD